MLYTHTYIHTYVYITHTQTHTYANTHTDILIYIMQKYFISLQCKNSYMSYTINF